MVTVGFSSIRSSYITACLLSPIFKLNMFYHRYKK